MNITGTAADIAHLSSLGQQVDDTISALNDYISTNDIFTKWNAALDDLKAETGIEFTYEGSPYYRDDLYYDWPRLDGDGITFEALDRDRERITFTIPFGFLSEETREETLNMLRADYAVVADEQVARRREKAEKARRDAERDVARAQARLAALTQP